MEIRRVLNAPLLQTAKGGFVAAQGQVSLEWKRQQGNSFYETDFYVFPSEAMNFDVILGAEYIFENNILTVNDHAMLPLLESNKNIKPGKLKWVQLEYTLLILISLTSRAKNLG